MAASVLGWGTCRNRHFQRPFFMCETSSAHGPANGARPRATTVLADERGGSPATSLGRTVPTGGRAVGPVTAR